MKTSKTDEGCCFDPGKFLLDPTLPLTIKYRNKHKRLVPILQSIFNCSDFKFSLITTNIFNKNEDNSLIKSIQKLFLDSGDDLCIKRNFISIGNIIKENKVGKSIYELFTQIIMILNQSVKSIDNCEDENEKVKELKSQNGGLIFDNFLGIQCIKIMCSHCQQVFNEDYQLLNSLYIDVKEPNLLQKYIERLQRERPTQTDEDYKCCSGAKVMWKTEYIQLPKYLFIFLNRHSNGQYNKSVILNNDHALIKTVTSTMEYKVIGLIEADPSEKNCTTKCLITDQWWQTHDGRSNEIEKKDSVTDKSVVFIMKYMDIPNKTRSISTETDAVDTIRSAECSTDIDFKNEKIRSEECSTDVDLVKEETTQTDECSTDVDFTNIDDLLNDIQENTLENIYLDSLIKVRIWTVAMIWKIFGIDKDNIMKCHKYFERFKEEENFMQFMFDFSSYICQSLRTCDDTLFSQDFLSGIFRGKDWNQSFKIILDIIEKSITYLNNIKKIKDITSVKQFEEFFVGLYQETIKCETCKFIRQDVDVQRKSILLNLPNKGQSDLSKILRKNLDVFNKCPKCHADTEHFEIFMKRGPKYLIINLKRNSNGQWNLCSFPDQKVIVIQINGRSTKFVIVAAVDFNKDKMGYTFKYNNNKSWIECGMNGAFKACDNDIISERTVALVFEKESPHFI